MTLMKKDANKMIAQIREFKILQWVSSINRRDGLAVTASDVTSRDNACRVPGHNSVQEVVCTDGNKTLDSGSVTVMIWVCTWGPQGRLEDFPGTSFTMYLY